MSINYKQLGSTHAVAWHTSPVYAPYNHSLPAIDIMMLFLEPIEQDLMQVQRPLPKNNAEWIAGFEEKMQELMAGE